MKRPFYQRVLLALFITFFAYPSIAVAQSDQSIVLATGSEYLRDNYTYRLETMLTYEHLTPNSDYGDWRSLDAALYAKVDRRVTAFAHFLL